MKTPIPYTNMLFHLPQSVVPLITSPMDSNTRRGKRGQKKMIKNTRMRRKENTRMTM
jgi:hypothetical protein